MTVSMFETKLQGRKKILKIAKVHLHGLKKLVSPISNNFHVDVELPRFVHNNRSTSHFSTEALEKTKLSAPEKLFSKFFMIVCRKPFKSRLIVPSLGVKSSMHPWITGDANVVR